MDFIQQAYKGENKWWQYVLTIVLTILGWQLVGIIPLVVTAVLHSDDTYEFQKAAENNFMGLGINANLYFFLIITMFVVGLAFLFIGIKSIHKRSIKTVLTTRDKFDWKRFFFAAIIWTIASLSVMLIDYFQHPQDFVWNFKLQPFVILVLLSLLYLPFQTSFEEVLFRGYFMQGLGIMLRNRWFPLIFTSVVFGLMHGFNPEVAKLGKLLFVYYIATGFLFGMITLVDEGLELSLGLHAANNAISAIFITTNWTIFQTDALFIDNSVPNINFMMWVPLLVIYPVVWFILYKKYGWNNISKKLFGKVEKPDELAEIGN